MYGGKTMSAEEYAIHRLKDWVGEEFRICDEFLKSNSETIPYDIKPRQGSAKVVKRILDDYDRSKK